ncbi:hypothetical protein [Brevibacterium aurantiacum]|uniref:Uncharacterized protein n=1 Tax=Brevibacterium aurantiacum TaxID=273384 RepID=A0A2H1K129_BREAU|nr:hypothetical protein [Brevibacterium aurantiacum]GEB21949.1 hypothetical protein BAU01nite_06820 [Brevibacterium aurantiacum]SMX93012.1 hypothetical protein BAUR9175_02977 [Brevibacterium aurantiacum]
MLNRFNPGRVIAGVFAGLRRRSQTGDEKFDVVAFLVLFGLPVAVAVLLICARVAIDEPEIWLAAAALLVGALLAGFSQVAGWRERILERGRSVDQVRVRALNEAGALILMCIHVSVLGSASLLCVALIEMKDHAGWVDWIAVGLSSIGPASLAYIALSLCLVVNLLWDGFTNEQEDSERENLEDFDGVD